MHISNLLNEQERPEGVRIAPEPDLYLDDWAEDGADRSLAVNLPVIVAEPAKGVEQQIGAEKVRSAQALATARLKAEAEKIAQETGVSIGFGTWAYRPKPKAAYNLWKKVVPLFAERREVLALGPTALARWLDEREDGFTVTRDMLYDRLNRLAISDLKRLLRKLGITMTLRYPVTICSLRKQFIERDGAKARGTATEFTGHFALKGDKLYVNGRPYSIQRSKSGSPRIQFHGSWLRVDVLQAICEKADKDV